MLLAFADFRYGRIIEELSIWWGSTSGVFVIIWGCGIDWERSFSALDVFVRWRDGAILLVRRGEADAFMVWLRHDVTAMGRVCREYTFLNESTFPVVGFDPVEVTDIMADLSEFLVADLTHSAAPGSLVEVRGRHCVNR